MKLGGKILFGFLSISISMAIVGLTVNYNSTKIQTKLVEDNINTTRMVELTARIERRLYQSLVYLSAIKETSETKVGLVTIDAPNLEMLENRFFEEIGFIHQNLFVLETFLSSESADFSDNNAVLFKDRFEFYEKMSVDWLTFRKEDQAGAVMVYNTSISPYFRNNIVPVISALRAHTMEQQLTRNKALRLRLAQAKWHVQLTSLFFILVSCGIGYYLYIHIANPLRKLTQSVQRLGDGHLEERIEVTRKDEIGQLADNFNAMATNLRKRTMARDYLDNIIESILEALIVTDEQDIIVGLNKAAVKMLGYQKEELIGKHINFIYINGEFEMQTESEGFSEDVFEFSLRSKEGYLVPVLFSQSKLKNAKKEMVGKVCVATDITQQKKANERIRKSLREKDVLLAEIHHRVKNNLAVISGILQLQSYASSNQKVISALQESQSRIKSISLVHEMLYKSEMVSSIDFHHYVQELLNEIQRLHVKEGKTLNVNLTISPFSIDVNKAIPCSMILNEIVVSSYQYGVKQHDVVEITIDISTEGNRVKLFIQDDGPDFKVDESTNAKPLELTLIETLTSQLEGSYIIEKPDADGLRTVIVEFDLD